MSDRTARKPAPETVVEAERTEIETVVEATVQSGGDPPAPASRNASEGIPYSAESMPDHASLVERIEKANLPPGLRTRLAEVAASGGGIDEMVRAVEEALPGVLRLSERDVSRPAHKAGEVFFRGDAEALSEERAEQVAREQLARTGMLRGQRVRVAD